jgi:hypothetical protein
LQFSVNIFTNIPNKHHILHYKTHISISYSFLDEGAEGAPGGAKPPSLHNGGTIRPAKPAAPGAKLIQHYVTQDNIQNVYSNVFGEYKNRFRRTLDSRFSLLLKNFKEYLGVLTIQGFAESRGRSKSAIFGRDEVSYENHPTSCITHSDICLAKRFREMFLVNIKIDLGEL